MIKKLLTGAVAAIGSLAIAMPALSYYEWRGYVGDIWINKWTVESDSQSTRVWLDVSMPSCKWPAQLDGYVGVDYEANDGGYMKNYKVSAAGLDGYNGWIKFVATFVKMDTKGKVEVTDATYCRPGVEEIDVPSIPIPPLPWPF